MVTSLSGTFIEFNASYTHASELGGRDTSIIKDINAHFILHEVMNDQPGRDGLKDFLADTLSDDLEFPGAFLVPDTLFESDCSTLPVNNLTVPENGVQYDGDRTTTVDVDATIENWVFVQVDDPAQAKLPIQSVVRSDGKVLNPNNAWTSIRYTFEENERLTFLNIFDFVDLGQYTYTVTYETPPADVTPPETTIRFQGDVEQVGNQYFVTPDTDVFFTVEDASPSGIFYRFAEDLDFLPFVPFRLSEPGAVTVEYFSRDNRGNEESVQAAVLVLSDQFPTVSDFVVDTGSFVSPGDAVSVRATTAKVSFDGGAPGFSINGLLEVFRGVYAFPTLTGVPSNPTTRDGAVITVGGDNVDFYSYSINDDPWTADQPVQQSLVLSALAGDVELRVRGRGERGVYDEDSIVTASWTVDGDADPIDITGPATPSVSQGSSFAVANASDFCYRLDGGAYVPDPGGPVVEVSDLAEGEHVIEFQRRDSGAEPCPGDEPGTALTWSVDRNYATALPESERILSQVFNDIGGSSINFEWDGTDANGAGVPPDVYSVKVSVTDALGRTTSRVDLVEVSDLVTTGALVAGVQGAAQRQAHAMGRWAVWQDQRNGAWDIFALDLLDPLGVPAPVQVSPLNQERPRTDGEYVVWEDRRPDGTWDIWAKKLGSPDPAFAVTDTVDSDERRPSIDWPWVVYQQRLVSDPGAPWQVAYTNLDTLAAGAVDPSGDDQTDPVVHRGRVVWEDRRDLGPGEIYFATLNPLAVRRITTNPAGQIQPTIYDDWIVWSDNRTGLQLDLYGLNLQRNVEIPLTSTSQDETMAKISGKWVIYADDSTGEEQPSLRLLNLGSLATIQLTNFESMKKSPNVASGKLTWVDDRTGTERIRITDVPDLQPVFDNNNTVVVTETMAARQGDAFGLLELWNREAGVTKIRRYTSLVPEPVAETATWNGAPAGTNFPLEAGAFLWVGFHEAQILDLGSMACAPVDVPAGVSALALNCFPDGFTAYEAIAELGPANVRAVRALDAEAGRWSVAFVQDNGTPFGENFTIPRIGVVLIDMQAAVDEWLPGSK